MTTPSRSVQLLALLAMLSAALFGLTTLGHPISMALGQWPLSTQLIIKLTSLEFVTVNAHTLQQVTLNYTRGFGGISLHTMLGSLALMACALQFFPALRRRWPRLHRVVGWTAVGGTVASMVGALWFLSITPVKDNVTGEAFTAALWMLALSTLFALSMAVATIRRREVRAHMGWMALLMASLMTAPLLRIEAVIAGRLLPVNIIQADAFIATFLMPQAVLLMVWWMQRVGSHDMPLLPAQPSLPPAALRGLSWLGVATVVHEGLLAPWGLDALSSVLHWRGDADRLPAIAGLWAVATALLLPRLRAALPDVIRGVPMGAGNLSLMALSGSGALMIALRLAPGGHLPNDLHQLERAFFWVAFGASNLLYALAGMVWRGQDRNHAIWRTMGLFNAFAPAVWIPYGLGVACTGWSAGAVISATLSLSWAMLTWHGFMTAFGLPQPGAKKMAIPHTGRSLA